MMRGLGGTSVASTTVVMTWARAVVFGLGEDGGGGGGLSTSGAVEDVPRTETAPGRLVIPPLPPAAASLVVEEDEEPVSTDSSLASRSLYVVLDAIRLACSGRLQMARLWSKMELLSFLLA